MHAGWLRGADSEKLEKLELNHKKQAVWRAIRMDMKVVKNNSFFT